MSGESGKVARRETIALAALAAAGNRTAPENVDAEIAPRASKRRSKSARTQNNFPREVTPDEQLDNRLGQHKTNQLAKQN